MKNRRRVVVGIVLTTLLVACSEGFLGPYDLDELSLAFGVVDESRPPSIEGEAGAVLVHGSVSTSMCGYRLSATLVDRPDVLELRVVAEWQGGVAIFCNYPYEARIGGMKPGLHRVRLVHQIDDAAPTTVLTADVRVE